MNDPHILRGDAVEPIIATVFSGSRAFSALPTTVQDTPDGSSHAETETAAALWRQAVHDLRGLLGVVSAVTAALQRPSSNERRGALLAMLDRNVDGMRKLLNGVADLARLDAMREQPVLRRLDFSLMLDELCSSFQELAISRGLRLESRGPRQLLAESDALMVTRMVQNLMLNAISYTKAAGVVLTWGTCDDPPASGHWYLEIADSTCLAAAVNEPELHAAPAVAPAWNHGAGEGIGLSIVKRLCGALGGKMQIVCKGTVRSTRIELPRRYAGSLEELTIAATEPRLSPEEVARTEPDIARIPAGPTPGAGSPDPRAPRA